MWDGVDVLVNESQMLIRGVGLGGDIGNITSIGAAMHPT